MTGISLKWLRGVVISLLVLLAVQFEFGMATNLSNPPTLSPLSFSYSALLNALNQIGGVAVIHAALGTGLTIFSVIALVLALVSRVRSVQITGLLSFLTIALAETNGLLFTLSGFQNDGYSHGMATMFILTFSLYFLELYFLKPPAGKTLQKKP